MITLVACVYGRPRHGSVRKVKYIVRVSQALCPAPYIDQRRLSKPSEDNMLPALKQSGIARHDDDDDDDLRARCRGFETSDDNDRRIEVRKLGVK